MRKILLIFLIPVFLLSTISSAEAEDETIKLGARYEVKKKQSIELRVTQVPKRYPWIEKDLKGKTLNPDYDSTIVAQNVKALEITNALGEKYTIPAGSKFFAKVTGLTPAKSFWRKEKVQLDFFALAISDGSFDEYFEETSMQAYDGKTPIQANLSSGSIDLGDTLNYDSRNDESMKDILSNLGQIGAYTLGGAIAGPIMLFSISSVVGAVTTVSALSNPYVVGGAAAVGGAVGLAAGIVKRGGDVRIEPGQKISITLDNTWQITKLLGDKLKDKSPLKAETINKDFLLEIAKVKKTRDSFGDVAIQVTFYYANRTNDEISYSSFQLIDSTGKAYEPNVDDLSSAFFDGLPDKGVLRLSFTVDYPNAPHQLKVLDRRSRKTLSYKEVVLN